MKHDLYRITLSDGKIVNGVFDGDVSYGFVRLINSESVKVEFYATSIVERIEFLEECSIESGGILLTATEVELRNACEALDRKE